MYLDAIAAKIRAGIPSDRMPKGDHDELLRLYAMLLRVKGASVTPSNVHDVWSAWMAERNPEHESLVEYENLPIAVQKEDLVFVLAIQKAAKELGQTGDIQPSFAEILFPSGPPIEATSYQQVLDLYKIMVQSSEGLVNRRQSVNTFFLTMNGALLTAIGLIVQSSANSEVGGFGISVLALAGGVLCGAWRSLITSFGQLNRGKFRVINTIEKYLKAAIYAAEWEALGRGENPKVYRPFTSREIWVPNALLGLYAISIVIALLVGFGFVSLNV